MYVRILQVALLPTLQHPEYEKSHRFIRNHQSEDSKEAAYLIMMAYGSTLYIGKAPKKMAATLKCTNDTLVHVEFCGVHSWQLEWHKI